MMSSVLISCITRDIIHAETVQWLCQRDWPVDIVKGSYTIEHQRNEQVRRFLKSKADYLFIIDNDVIPKYGTIESLLGFTQEEPDAIHVAPCMAVDEANRPHPMAYQEIPIYMPVLDLATYTDMRFVPATYELTEKLEVVMTGMSGALIPRKVLTDIKRNWFHMQHDEEGNLIGTEDIWFWRMVRALGWKLYAHCYLTADHIKLWRLGSL